MKSPILPAVCLLMLVMLSPLMVRGQVDQYFDDIDKAKNLVKWDATELIIGMLSLSYERVFDPVMIEVGGEYQLPYFNFQYFGFFGLNQDIVFFNGDSITGGFGYFIVPKYELAEVLGDKFWIGAMYRSRTFNVADAPNVRSIDYSLMAGNEFVIGRQLNLSYWIGFGRRSYVEVNKDVEEPERYNTISVPISLKISFVF